MQEALGPEWLVLSPGGSWLGHRFDVIVLATGWALAGVSEEAQRLRDWQAMLVSLKLAPDGKVVRL